MKADHIKQIIEKYFKGGYSKELEQLFGKWLLKDEKQEQKDAVIRDLWDEINVSADISTIRDLDLLHDKMDSEKPTRRFKLSYRFMKIAAAIMIPLICSLLAYRFTESFYVDNSDFVECYVNYGEQEQITLPDSTKVWVNSGTVLIYPEKFIGKTRSVYLNGEAYFEVAKDAKKRFIVRTNDIDVEALGTVFNVQAYQDLGKTVTTLEEGKIKVGVKSASPKSLILLPNEQVIYDRKTGTLIRKTVDAGRIARWIDKYLVFQEASFAEILSALEKRFGVICQYDAAKYENRLFTIRFSPDETLEEALDILKEVCKDFDYKIKDNKVFVQ